MSYLEQVLPYLYETGSISVLDIHRVTKTTCGHKVIQRLVQKDIIDEGEWQVSSSGKRFKVHKLKNTQLRMEM
jgi:hypothetical protein